MKIIKVQILILLTFAVLATGASWAGAGEGSLADPAKLSAKEFKIKEEQLLEGFSGSSGYFLEDEDIEWLKKGREIHPVGAGETGREDLHKISAISLSNMLRYREAAAEYEKANLPVQAAQMDWLVRNPKLQDGGSPDLRFITGRLPMGQLGSTETAEDAGRLFVSEFKGAVFLSELAQDRYAVIFVPEDEYNWLRNIKFTGGKLTGILHNSERQFAYDPSANLVTIQRGKMADGGK